MPLYLQLLAWFCDKSSFIPRKNEEIIQTRLKDMQPEIIYIQETSESINDRKLNYFDVRIKSPDKLNNPFFAQQFIENLKKLPRH